MRTDAESVPAVTPLREVEPPPREGVVDVWRVSLSPDEAILSAFESGLSEEERERRGRFHFRRDAEKFIASHGALRTILGAYAGLRPRDIIFSRSSFGKPSLREVGDSRARIRFNMADSDDIALVAVSSGREVGVDIERIKAGADLSGAALRCFCEAEMAAYRAAAKERKDDVFYTFWTRKEAYIKARGEGMSLVLTAIDVSAAPVMLDGRWSLEDLTVAGGYRGAVVLDGNIRSVRYRTLSSPGAPAPM